MAGNALPLLLGAAAVLFLMKKKGNGETGDTDGGGNGDANGDGNGNGNGDGTDDGGGNGNGTDDGNGNGTGTGIIGGIKGGTTTKTVVKTIPFSSIIYGGGALGAKTNCSRVVFLPQKVGDTLEVTGWPAGTYGLQALGGTYILAQDVLEAVAVGGKLLVTLKSGTSAPANFYVKFRGGAGLAGNSTMLRYLYIAGVPQQDSWQCSENEKQE